MQAKTPTQIAAEQRGREARKAGGLSDLSGNPYRDDTGPENLPWHWHHGWHMEDADIADRKAARM